MNKEITARVSNMDKGVKDIDNGIRIQRQTDEMGTESTSATRGASAAGMKK